MTACQRWNPGRVQSWRRPSDGGFNPASYGVQAIPDDTTAEAFVTRLHYSGSYVNARQRYGLFALTGPEPVLAGVAVLSIPSNKLVLTNVFPKLTAYYESLELGRFVLVDAVAANGESWFLAEVRRLAAATGIRGIVSFSDPVRRTTLAGQEVMPGHVGVIYQASNAVYTGQSTKRWEWLLPDGTVFSDRTAQKIRKQEKGHLYAERLLMAHGARPPRAGERPADWLAIALDQAHARRFVHPGKHRYAFAAGKTRRARQAVTIEPRPRAYPKADLGQLAMFDPTDSGRDSGDHFRIGGSGLRAIPQTDSRTTGAVGSPAAARAFQGRPSRPAQTSGAAS